MTKTNLILWVELGVAGCSPVTPAVSFRPVPVVASASPRSPGCDEVAKILERARVLSDNHRPLRAELYRERANALCTEQANLAKAEVESDNGQSLEEVYRWLARNDSRLAFSSNRFENEPLAQRLDQAVLALSPKQPPVVVPIRGYDTTPATIVGDWVALTADSLSRKGEWFERYAELPEGLLCGPFQDRIILLHRNPFSDRSCVVFDLVKGKILLDLPMPAASPIDFVSPGPVALDATHFALPVVTPSAKQSKYNKPIPNVEIWQTDGLARVASFTAPRLSDVAAMRVIVSRNVPSAVGPAITKPTLSASKPKLVDSTASIRVCGYAREELESALDGGPALNAMYLLASELLISEWTGAVTVSRWKDARVMVTLPSLSVYASSVSLSPNARYLSFRPSPQSVGIFDRSTSKSRVSEAPGFVDLNPALFSPDSRFVATGGSLGYAYLWDVSTGRLVRTLGHSTGGAGASLTGKVTVLGFVRNGQELIVENDGLRRFSLRTGEAIDFGIENPKLRPVKYVTRSEGSVAFVDRNGCVPLEVSAQGKETRQSCSVKGALLAVSEDGELLVRAQVKTGVASLALVQTRGDGLKGEWPAPTYSYPSPRTSFSPDGSFVFSRYGAVMDVATQRELWPLRIFEEAHYASPSTAARVAPLLPQGEFFGRVRSALQMAEPRRTAAREETFRSSKREMKSGEYTVKCDDAATSTHLYQNERWLASRPGCATPVFGEGAMNRVLLLDQRTFFWWSPKTGKEDPLPFSGSDDPPIGKAQVDNGILTVIYAVGRLDSPEPHRLALFRLSDNRKLWQVVLEDNPVDLRFSRIALRQVFRARVGRSVFAWDVDTGKELEHWKDVMGYAEVPASNLLLLLSGSNVGFARISPPARLFRVYPQAQGTGAFIAAEDGRIEFLGERTWVPLGFRCMAGHRVLPFAACTERLEWPGLMNELLTLATSATVNELPL